MTGRSHTSRTSAEVRRRQVVECAVAEFAQHGFKGATTEAIARQVGVSQPYLFRLLPSKHAIFLETLTHAFELLKKAESNPGEGSASACLRLLRRDAGQLAKLLLQGCAAACDDEEVADLLRNRLGLLAAQLGFRDEELADELLRPVLGPRLLPAPRTASPPSSAVRCA